MRAPPIPTIAATGNRTSSARATMLQPSAQMTWAIRKENPMPICHSQFTMVNSSTTSQRPRVSR